MNSGTGAHTRTRPVVGVLRGFCPPSLPDDLRYIELMSFLCRMQLKGFVRKLVG